MIKLFTFSSSVDTLKDFQDQINDYLEKNNVKDFKVKMSQSEFNGELNITVMIISKELNE